MMHNMFARWQIAARRLKGEVVALYLAYRDPRTPILARLLALIVVGYAFSPIDLIPDFIPLLGYLDDLILLPLGIALVIRLIPPPVMVESRAKAKALLDQRRPTNWVAAALIVAIWLVLLVLGILWVRNLYIGRSAFVPCPQQFHCRVGGGHLSGGPSQRFL
ncbi:MAG: DUF1232 domain-containing protein [Caldilineaceae bacterium]|nr:DUF1232 domain-containing protein [Caldilineaceae bacterium]